MTVTEDTKRKYEKMAEDAIEYGMKIRGAPYPRTEDFTPWPALSPIYSHITGHDHAAWYQKRYVICSGLINVLRYEVANLPSVGWKQDDPYPGGMGAIGRQFGDTDIDGVRRYDHHDPTPRGWLCVAPYWGDALTKQGHVALALEREVRLLEARLWEVTSNRHEEEVSDLMVRYGGAPFTWIVAPWVWLRK